MDKEKIANFIAYFGLMLGAGTGCIITHLELSMSPISYTESHMGLIPYFYSPCAIISTFFLAVRYLLLTQYKLRMILYFSALIIILSTLYAYGTTWGQILSTLAIWIAFPILLIDLFLTNKKIRAYLNKHLF